MRDPYESLEVARSATATSIKRSFRELAKKLHPDANNTLQQRSRKRRSR
jgi:DnaJ-class molecular chaperone